jgi:hypothetical protein
MTGKITKPFFEKRKKRKEKSALISYVLNRKSGDTRGISDLIRTTKCCSLLGVREKSSKVAVAYRLNPVNPVQKKLFRRQVQNPTLPANKRPKTFSMLY